MGIAVLKIDYTKPLNTTDAFFPYYYITDDYSQSITQRYQHTHYPQCSGVIFCLQHLHLRNRLRNWFCCFNIREGDLQERSANHHVCQSTNWGERKGIMNCNAHFFQQNPKPNLIGPGANEPTTAWPTPTISNCHARVTTWLRRTKQLRIGLG